MEGVGVGVLDGFVGVANALFSVVVGVRAQDVLFLCIRCAAAVEFAEGAGEELA
jgi:hypothetical protein